MYLPTNVIENISIYILWEGLVVVSDHIKEEKNLKYYFMTFRMQPVEWMGYFI